MKKILAILIALFPFALYGQTYPSPTFNTVTLQNPLTVANGGTGTSSATGTGSAVLSNSPTFTGSVVIPFTQTGTNAVARTLGTRANDFVDAADYGVVCDGVTDNTTAFNNAVQAAQAASRPLYIFGKGAVCKTDEINYGSQPYANQISIIGDGVTLQKISSDGNPLMVIGNIAATNFTGPIIIKGITFSGIAGNTPAAVESYDLVRSSFVNDVFENSNVGYLSYGGISNDFYNNSFQNNDIGFKATTFASSAGGGIPNLLSFYGSKFNNNTSLGGSYNGGNALYVNGFDIEGNGTTGVSGDGGFYVNALTTGVGANFDNGWFEGNSGGQNISFAGGENTLKNAIFINSPNATVDLAVSGGNYSVYDVQCVNSKTENITETGTIAGNTISGTRCANISYDPTKTNVFSSGGNDLSANLAVTGDISSTGSGTFVGINGNVNGVTNGSNAPVGTVGEYPTPGTATATSLTTATASNCASITLPAGEYDVSGVITFLPNASTTISSVYAGINTTSATISVGNTGQTTILHASFTTGGAQYVSTPTVRIGPSATSTTVYLVGQSDFGVSTMTCNGFIRARRVH